MSNPDENQWQVQENPRTMGDMNSQVNETPRNYFSQVSLIVLDNLLLSR